MPRIRAAWRPCSESVARSGEPLRKGPAALLQSILDRQVDGIEPMLDDFEERLGVLEEQVLAGPRAEHLASLVAVRRNIVHLRRWLGLQRDVVLRLARQEFDLIPPAEALLFRDTHDHLAHFTEFLETYRELTNSIQEAYLSVVNNRLGENMRFLTLFSVGHVAPDRDHRHLRHELRAHARAAHRWGFPLTLASMAVVSGSVLLYFWRRGWLGRPPPIEPMLTAGRPAVRLPGDGDKGSRRTLPTTRSQH